MLWESEPLHDLALMATKQVPAKHVAAVTKAFLEMGHEPQGQKILATASQLVKLPPSTIFVPATAADYAGYRTFYLTAPANLR